MNIIAQGRCGWNENLLGTIKPAKSAKVAKGGLSLIGANLSQQTTVDITC